MKMEAVGDSTEGIHFGSKKTCASLFRAFRSFIASRMAAIP